jgi:predicted GTPase
MSKPLRCIILGAAGRDFHDFQTFFRYRPEFQVVAFTASQIPFIENREFPKELAGALYDSDLPIFSEDELPALIARLGIDLVFLAYSDLSHEDVMHKASLVQSCGAGFALLGPHLTQLRSRAPVIAVTAVRTGAGKSPITQAIARHLVAKKRSVVVLRHPMPYGDLRQQRAIRFASEKDLVTHNCTIEEREEYEPYIEAGIPIFAGVDYQSILLQAEKECDVILWDGGNNDYAFVRPNLSIVVLDALRPGHETSYYPGETNLRAADVLVLNKVSDASAEALAIVRRNAARLNPDAILVESNLVVACQSNRSIAGKRVVVVEDGPSITHGGMAYGAGMIAARAAEAKILDPRGFAIGSIAESYRRFPHIAAVVPSLGYSPAQRAELEEMLRRCDAEVIVDATPARIERFLNLNIPVVHVGYRFEQKSGPSIFGIVDSVLSQSET